MSVITLQGENEKRLGIYYEVDTSIAPIGAGGMGQVFKGLCVNQQTGATRSVAIKFMYDDLPEHAIERARREASICLRNDNLVEMLGFFETVDRDAVGTLKKHYHVVSELLTGVSLSDVLEGKTKDAYGNDVPFAIKMAQDFKNDPEHFATIIVTSVLSGLMALHDAGYIHRDIDPTNIMLTTEGKVKLIDYGIAKQMNNLTTKDKSLTVAGSFMGKPEYASPELVLGDVKHQNQTTDIYAVGILLYQCIIGHPPFEGPRHEVLDKQMKSKLPLSKIKNKGLRNIIAKACEKKQELRYQTSAQMRVAFETLNGVKPSMSRNKKISIIAACVACVVVFGIGSFKLKQKHEMEQTQTEQLVVEKANQKVIADFDDKLSQANDVYSQGLDLESDSCEIRLFKAYALFASLAKEVKSNPALISSEKEVVEKMQLIIGKLNSIEEILKKQATELNELGEAEIASTCQQRADAISKFLKTTK